MANTPDTTVILSDKSYNVGKKLVQVWIPAVSSLYFGLASVWGLPGAEQIMGTLAVLATFLGVILGVSSRQYQNSDKAYDGDMVVTPTDTGGAIVSLELNKEAQDFANVEGKDVIRFRVKKKPEIATAEPPEV